MGDPMRVLYQAEGRFAGSWVTAFYDEPEEAVAAARRWQQEGWTTHVRASFRPWIPVEGRTDRDLVWALRRQAEDIAAGRW